MASGRGCINLFYYVDGIDYSSSISKFDLYYYNSSIAIIGIEKDTDRGCYYISFDNVGLESGDSLKVDIAFNDDSLTLDSIRWVIKSEDGGFSDIITSTSNKGKFTFPSTITPDTSVRLNIAPQIINNGGTGGDSTTTTYTISYNATGGSGAPSSQKKVEGDPIRLSSTKPTKSGYTFLGWGTYNGDTSVNYSPGEWYYNDSDLSLYAIWQKNSGEDVGGDTSGVTKPSTPGTYMAYLNGSPLKFKGSDGNDYYMYVTWK